MGELTFFHRIDLLVSLYDTTTGRPIEKGEVFFKKNGQDTFPLSKGDGNFVFINTGREDHLMQVFVSEYEDCSVRVRYEELSDNLPTAVLQLIPKEIGKRAFFSLEGSMPGVKKIMAISLVNPICSTQSYDRRRQALTLLPAGGGTALGEGAYGLYHTKDGIFERFEVDGNSSSRIVRLKKPLEKGFAVNAPISRVVEGMAGEDGRYLLRVQRDEKNALYLVCFQMKDGEEKFEKVDFREGKGGEK